jgi:serine protease Do
MPISIRFQQLVFSIVLVVLVLSARLALAQELSTAAPLAKSPLSTEDRNANADQVKATARELSAAFRFAAAKVMPSVVVVLGKRPDVNESLDQLGLLEENSTNFSAGSGVILDPSGTIITNSHVVSGFKEVRVRLADGHEYTATDIKSDKASDLAILKIHAPDPLPAIEIGDSTTTSVGDWVIAVGSPFLLEQTVSAGIVSGNARLIRGLVSGQLLQTDASINPGNSGGALANLDGQLVGINTAIASDTGTFMGVGFAIPSKRVKWIVSELESRGMVRRAALGVTTVDVPLEIATKLNLPVKNGGAYVGLVRPNSPAATAKLEHGDTIFQVADQVVHNPVELSSVIEQSPIGEPIVLHIFRDKERKEVTVILEERK